MNAVFLMWLGSGCGKTVELGGSPTSSDTELYLTAMADGRLLVDGRPVTLTALEKRLEVLAEHAGTVWYYREDAAAEPHPNAAAAFDLVLDHQLPVTLSTRPDFGDYVTPDGVVHPR